MDNEHRPFLPVNDGILENKPMMTAPPPLAFATLESDVLLICADAILAWRYLVEIASAGGPQHAPHAASIVRAEAILRGWKPQVILLDGSCLELASGDISAFVEIERVVAILTEHAPVVLVAPAQCRKPLAFLIAAGAVDLVERSGDFVPVTAGLVVRRAQLGEQALSGAPGERECARDFGEMLRHEVNNPLTGILGNAEMLLKIRGELPPPVTARLETIADLAVRLREIIRRLSDCWEAQHDSARAV
jgi:signal transduction histidine kinase